MCGANGQGQGQQFGQPPAVDMGFGQPPLERAMDGVGQQMPPGMSPGDAHAGGSAYQLGGVMGAVMPGAAPLPKDPMMWAEACLVKLPLNAAVGGVMGGVMGLFLGSYNIAPAIVAPGVPPPPKRNFKQEMGLYARETGKKSRGWGKNFAMVTVVYSGLECYIEKYRGVHDAANSALAGCATGAVLAHAGGPQGMALGCGGFAAFSVAIDYIMHPSYD